MGIIAFSEWGGLKSNRNSVGTQKMWQNDKNTLSDAAIDAMFKEIFDGNATLNTLFDEHGVLDPEAKKVRRIAPRDGGMAFMT